MNDKVNQRIEEIIVWTRKSILNRLIGKTVPGGDWSGILGVTFIFHEGGVNASLETEEPSMDKSDKYMGHKPSPSVLDNAFKGFEMKLRGALSNDYHGRISLSVYLFDGLCTMWSTPNERSFRGKDIFSRP